jgi:hypothetical protein
MALLALAIGACALVLSSTGVWAAVAWRRNQKRYKALAEEIDVGARMEYLTTQTLKKMQDVTRQVIGRQW